MLLLPQNLWAWVQTLRLGGTTVALTAMTDWFDRSFSVLTMAYFFGTFNFDPDPCATSTLPSLRGFGIHLQQRDAAVRPAWEQKAVLHGGVDGSLPQFLGRSGSIIDSSKLIVCSYVMLAPPPGF